MSTSAPKLTISTEELHAPHVEEKLKQHQLVRGTREHYETVQVVAAAPKRIRFTLLYNTIVYMSLFGALGGLLGWAFGEVMHFGPNPRMEAIELLDGERQLQTEIDIGRTTQREAEIIRNTLHRTGRENPYYATWTDSELTKEQKNARVAELMRQDYWRNFLADALFYSVSGMMIAICLAAAESVVERNWAGAAVYASVGAIAGLIGGVVVSLFVDRLYNALVGGPGSIDTSRQIIARGVSWGVLGLFLSAAPGLVLRNMKRVQVGLVGGLIGGVVGGILFDPVAKLSGNNLHLSRLIAILAIGVVSGLATGIIENVIKTGWVKVIAGLITGKQFVLYRNPTYIGSSPQSHIYLFKDPKVGRRHAAIHIIPGGYEIEDLPLGTRTMVNGKPIARQKLRTNDKIQIGGTTFSFQEKKKS